MKMQIGEVKVWDIAIRLIHWLLVVAFFIAYVTEDDFEWLHVNAGYLIIGLVGFRLVWGFIGSKYARFSNFIYRPSVVMDYLAQSSRFKGKRYLGHNPAGGMMVIALLIMLMGTSVTGLFVYGIEDLSGPFAGVFQGEFYADVFEEMHEIAANLMILMILVHVAGVIFASIEHGENLVRSMVTGKKRGLAK